ncbi:hypothetical protein Hanom_Chr06g00544281 [Helianthus anomalus]
MLYHESNLVVLSRFFRVGTALVLLVFVNAGLDMYHPYSISIRVILELLIRYQAFSECTS